MNTISLFWSLIAECAFRVSRDWWVDSFVCPISEILILSCGSVLSGVVILFSIEIVAASVSPGFKRPLSKEVTSLYWLFFAFVCSIDEVEVLCSVLGCSLFSEVVDLLFEQATKTVAKIKMIDVENSFSQF